MRENRTHGSEGGDGESRSRPLSDLELAITQQAAGNYPNEIKLALAMRNLLIYL